jgi:D-alanyl-D-alanine carboxypeptidase/D-alanyl-D-alanine-endopeptidase (penicillin-binding protein 4)
VEAALVGEVADGDFEDLRVLVEAHRSDYNFRVRASSFRRSLSALLALLLGVWAPGASAAEAPPSISPIGLSAALRTAAQKAPTTNLSISVTDLDTGEVVFEQNPDRALPLASITKAITSAAAIHYLGPSYKFRTTFWRRGEIREGSLTGSLLVVGGGDPNISGRFYNDDYNAVFDTWAQGLQRAGITRVVGDLVLNATFFDGVARHPDWPADQADKWYQAPVSALSYNDNCVLVSIGPGGKIGKPAAVTILPDTDLVRPVSRATTVSRKRRPRVVVSRDLGSDAVRVGGVVPMRKAWWSTPIAIDDAPAFFGDALKKRMAVAGIELTGSVVQRDWRPDGAWTLIAQTESDLVPTIAVSNKRSQGFYAEQIAKTLAAEKTGKGSWEASTGLVRGFLGSLGLDPGRFSVRDGSGLSVDNRASAEDLTAFFRNMTQHPHGPLWRSTLAVSGEAGSTLRGRLRDPVMAGRIEGKTGSLRGVSTLAGYATASSGRTYVFAILLNGNRVWDSTGHRYQDRILRALVKNG